MESTFGGTVNDAPHLGDHIPQNREYITGAVLAISNILNWLPVTVYVE